MNILITGANRGIGKSVVKKALSDGHHVIATGRSLEKLNELQNELGNSGSGQLSLLELDVNNADSVIEASKKLIDIVTELDVLVNNAGIISDATATDLVQEKEMKRILETNFYGPLRTSQSFLPSLEKSQSARIINVSSGMGALEGMGSGYAAYRLSKTALNGLTAVMAADLDPKGIKVFSVCPGWVHTDMGGANAPRTPEEGAASIYYLIESENPSSGKFYRDGSIIAW